MVEAVIFDLWDTLIFTDVENPLYKAQRLLGYDDRNFEEFMQKFQPAFMTRRFDNYEAAFAHVCVVFGVNDEKVYAVLAATWKEERSRLFVYPEVHDVLSEITQRYRLGMVSNSFVDLRQAIDELEISQYFGDAIVLSHEVGVVKPDERIFREALRRLGSMPEEAVMVGDRIVDDVEGAVRAGITGILLDRKNEHSDYPLVITSLTELENVLRRLP